METQEFRPSLGRHGCVYRLPNGHAAKVPHQGTEYDICFTELPINRMLYDDGFPVPKVYDFKDVNIDGVGTKRALVREFVEGKKISDIDDNDMQESCYEEYERILDSTIARGFVPGDRASCNGIVTPDGRIVLIDFAEWGYRGGGK